MEQESNKKKNKIMQEVELEIKQNMLLQAKAHGLKRQSTQRFQTKVKNKEQRQIIPLMNHAQTKLTDLDNKCLQNGPFHFIDQDKCIMNIAGMWFQFFRNVFVVLSHFCLKTYKIQLGVQMSFRRQTGEYKFNIYICSSTDCDRKALNIKYSCSHC